MLKLLRIRNFAIIDELELEFDARFNAITGETGAGKSIVLDAVGLLLGNRAQTDLIRDGFDEAIVESVFDLSKNPSMRERCADMGLSLEDGELLLKRSVQRTGKGRVYANGGLITVAQLAALTEGMVDLCSQHEHQSLVRSATQLDLIDTYGGLLDARAELRETVFQIETAQKDQAALGGSESERQRTLEFLRFQANEIASFAPVSGEEETLTQERRKLANAKQLAEQVTAALELLGEGASEEAADIRVLVGKCGHRIAKAAAYDPEGLAPAVSLCEQARVLVDELLDSLSRYAGALEMDPERLETIEARLSGYSDLKRKYGPTTEDMLNTKDRIEKELFLLENRQEEIRRLDELLAHWMERYRRQAKELSRKRKSIAKTLAKTIEGELSDLKMDGARFELSFGNEDFDHVAPTGADEVQFLLSANPGETPKPLGKIASGGELSRILLAIRRTIADRGGIGVYLFDEIDAGIGGQTASVVGKKLRSVAKFNQVICITHLPQVAACADAQFHVSKRTSGGRTKSDVRKLSGSERVGEIARMLGGESVTEKSKAMAKDLIKQAEAN